MPESVRINFVTGAPIRYVGDVEALAAVPERLEAALAGRSGAWMQTPVAPGEWSPARIVGHMIAYARQSHENLYRMAWMTDPIIKTVDDAGEAERNAWEARDAARLREWFDESVAETVHLLEELPDSSWGRPGQHPITGRRSIKQQVRAMVAHFNEHIAQLESASTD